MDNVILKKDGLWSKTWNRETKKYDVERVHLDTHLFFQAWNVGLTIKGKVKLKDLVENVFRKMDPLVLDFVAKIVGANLEDYLKCDLKPLRDPDRKSKLKFIEVYKYYELGNWDTIKDWDFEDGAVSAHGIGDYWSNEDSPGQKKVPLKDRGNSYAIEFTPWCYLMNLPLRLKERTVITKTTWKKAKKRKVGFFKKGSKKGEFLFQTDRKHVSWENIDVRVSYTLGEFFDGLLDELCFFWTPARRDQEHEGLKGTMEDVKKVNKDDFVEMKEYD